MNQLNNEEKRNNELINDERKQLNKLNTEKYKIVQEMDCTKSRYNI